MRTGLHPELGVSADDGRRPGAGDHNCPTCGRSAWRSEDAGPPCDWRLLLADFPSPLPAGLASGSLELDATTSAWEVSALCGSGAGLG